MRHWPDRELAVTLNRYAQQDGGWETVDCGRRAPLRERLGIEAYDPAAVKTETITIDETAHRLNVCVGSAKRLIREGVLPATQLMPSAHWQIPVAPLDTETVKLGVRAVIERRPRNFPVLQDLKTLRRPGF